MPEHARSKRQREREGDRAEDERAAGELDVRHAPIVAAKPSYLCDNLVEKVVALASSLALLLGSLHGIVMRGPIMPVCMVGKPCDAPAANLRLRFTRAGTSVIVRTDATGHYRVRLAAGIWAVSTAKPQTIGGGVEPRSVRVRAGRDARVDLHVDTGIR